MQSASLLYSARLLRPCAQRSSRLQPTSKRSISTSTGRAASAPRWKRYEVTASGVGARCSTSDGSFTMTTDVPASMGGTDTGPQPVNQLLSALCGCKTATAAFVAVKMKPRVALGRLTFQLVAERDERGSLGMPLESDNGVPARLQGVYGTCHIEGEISDEEIEILAKQVHKRCPVANMFEASGCAVDIEWARAEP